jgi:dienelactone hydrolase
MTDDYDYDDDDYDNDNGSDTERRTIRALLRIGDLDSIRPVRTRADPPQPADGAWRARVVLTAPDGHEVPCFFLMPTTPPPWGAAVVAVHQHNGEFAWGKSEVAGIVGDPGSAYGAELAAAGIPVLAPDLMGFEERGSAVDPARAEQLDAWARITREETLLGLHVQDVALAVSWLEDNDDVAGPVGIVGHSLGGQVAFFSLACDSRVRAGVLSCGIGTLASFDDGGILHNPAWYVPGLRAAGDVPRAARAIHGQAVCVLAGRTDPIFPFAGVREVVAALPDDAVFVPFDGGHTFPATERAEALEWLGRALAGGE